MSEAIFDHVEGTREAFQDHNAGAVSDVLGVLVLTGRGSGMSLSIPLPAPRPPTPREKRDLGRLGAHLGAGLRLRSALAGSSEAPEPEAVLDPSGRIHDARGEAAERNPRTTLREAVRRLESARTRKRRRDPESLSLWEGLVCGRWSLVDRFEADGRRFIVAHRNEPALGDPRGLSLRELHVAELVGVGCTNKEIAYELGSSESAVANAISSIRRKLGLKTRVELASFFAPGGVRARLSTCELEGESFLVGIADIVDADELARLTAAEREVALHLLRGATNTEISRLRGTSQHTTANQIKSLYERLGVDSRASLAAHMTGTRKT